MRIHTLTHRRSYGSSEASSSFPFPVQMFLPATISLSLAIADKKCFCPNPKLRTQRRCIALEQHVPVPPAESLHQKVHIAGLRTTSTVTALGKNIRIGDEERVSPGNDFNNQERLFILFNCLIRFVSFGLLSFEKGSVIVDWVLGLRIIHDDSPKIPKYFRGLVFSLARALHSLIYFTCRSLRTLGWH